MRKTIEQDKYISGDSESWANWQAELNLNVCTYCAKQHGRIVAITVLGDKLSINAHPHCRCVYVPMRTKEAGTATDEGLFGPDMYLIILEQLPDNYILKKQARSMGWIDDQGNLADVLPGMVIGGDIFQNRNGKLPHAPGRIWREADINYIGGYRNVQRLVYSNDGLIFVSYDHYHTFYELTE